MSVSLRAEEASRFAVDVLDASVQRLFAVGLTLESASRRLGTGDTEAAAALAAAVDEVDAAIHEIRAYVRDLHP
ncbi:MAG TPA: histidine kinase [Candidatus Angelobacter sp.]|jgi:signal transduction histidine kinase|nr:histidine kinase [Candidatus Angelobacter sp.]